MSGPQTDSHHDGWRLPAAAPESASDPDVDYYLAHITSVRSVDGLLADERLYRFALAAFGLAEMNEARSFMRRVLSEGSGGAKGFALEVADQRLRDIAEVFDFAAHGMQTTQRDAARDGVASRYRRIGFEAEAGRRDEGARLALAFERKIGGVKSVYGLLGDSDLYTVTRIALGLPAAGAGMEIERQAAAIAAQIDLGSFEDADQLSAFLQRFSAQWRRLRGTGDSPEATAAGGRPPVRVLSSDVLMNVQAMKTGSS